MYLMSISSSIPTPKKEKRRFFRGVLLVMAVLGLQQMIGHQQLAERQGMGLEHLAGGAGNRAYAIVAEVMVLAGDVAPQQIFQALGLLIGDITGDLQPINGEVHVAVQQ